MAEKGKIGVIRDNTGGVVIDAKTGTQYEFSQIFTKELCLNQDDRVKFDILNVPGAKPVAVNVERITAGTVLSYDPSSSTGTIEERGSKKVVNFYQAYAKEMGIDPGDVVRYSLISTTKGEMAVNLEEVVD